MKQNISVKGNARVAGVWNINSVYDTNAKRVSRKLSFEIGQKFLARIVNLDKVNGEILLKLLDGWQFSAKLQKPLENFPEGLLRFQVEGFQDGKLELKIASENTKQDTSEKDSIVNLIKEKNIDANGDDYQLLSNMVKHSIPLTKENVSKVKTVLDFINKVKENSNEEEEFIQKYVQSKNIDINSPKGEEIRNTLKSFFNQLKNITENDFLTMMENNIDLTEENIKSFNNVFKESKNVYDTIKNVGEEIFGKLSVDNNDSKQQGKTEVKNLTSENDYEFKNEKISIPDEKLNDIKISNTEKNIKIFNDNEEKNLNQIKPKDYEENKEKFDNFLDKGLDKVSDKSLDKVLGKDLDKNLDKAKKSNDEGIAKVLNDEMKDNKVNNLKDYSIDDIGKNIKEQIQAKTEEIKTIIKTILEQKIDKNSDTYNNIVKTLENNINDFKVYNMISNQYYYLDLPVNLDRYEYQCKLIIKDERKKGKKIDGTNVKIAASVNTEHMGIVDAYIKLNNSNMEVDIKSSKEWIKILNMQKEKILKDISNMGYNVYVRIDEKEKEMNIVNCREFFEDNNLSMIDTKV